MFNESLNSVTINIKVGKVVKSVGFGIYKAKSKIRTDTDKDKVKKKSSNEFGRGTIIIKRMEKTKATTPKSVTSLNIFSEFLTFFSRFNPYYIFKCVIFN